MTRSDSVRPLTYDQKRAAEAAFKGLPFDSAWSEAAKAVYDGIMAAQKGQPSVQLDPLSPDALAEVEPLPTKEDTKEEEPKSQEVITSREEAIEAGLLVDVTAIANDLGLPVPVAMTRSLWDYAITASGTIAEDQYETRVRDVLVALRLRLSTVRAPLPGLEFPALLTFPPDPAPQLCSLYAIAHGDKSAPISLTVMLSNEVAAIIPPGDQSTP